jgi:protein arginine kinase
MNKWFENPSKDGDVVISSRVRLARNFKKYPFPSENFPEGEEVISAAKNSLSSMNFEYLSMKDADEITRSSMVARHLISPPFSKNSSGGILYSPDESVSVMINEEDHLRIQVLLSGNNLTECYSLAEIIDDKISETNEYAFSEKLGYLTKCPTNLGTGLRASVMLHLPALEELGETGKLMSMLSKLGLTIRGTFGESTKAVGSIYQISNQITLGIDEKTSINNLSAIVSQISERERNARKSLYEKNLSFEDRFYRSFAILKNARLMSGEELYKHLSVIRIGASLGLIGMDKTAEITKLLFTTSAGEIMKGEQRNMSPEERDAARSRIVRESKLFD